TALAAGDYHSLALAADGTVWAWGFNANGQLGDGTTDERTNPTRVTALDGKDIIAVAAGGYHSLALAADGTVWTWGYNAFGQLGLSDYSHRNVPTQVAALDGKDIVAIAGGDSFSLALSDDGRVWAWGENSQGQLGDGTTDQHPSPVEVTGLADVKVTQIAAGTQHSIAVGSDGSLFCWGYNGYGQLGMGDLVDRHTPTQVAALADTQVTAIAAGASHSLALAADGSLWAYGYNNSGQLGVGSHATQSLPVEVSDLADSGQLGAVTAIAAGGSHSLALDAQGALWAWGANANGQLGIGTTVEQTRPVKLDTPADKVLTAFAAGRQHSLAFARIAQPEFVFTNRYIKAPVHPPVQPTPNPMVPTTGDTSNLFSVSAFMLTGCVIMIVAKVRRSAPSKSASR
ncbi:MAG: hypothetical protein FWD41_01095, partial [Actinomycetia bacterium]|nr:hypothetical protein [Actinomycetes bacterium]